MSKKDITYARLHEVLDYNSETGIFVWIVPICNGVNVGDVAGCGSKKDYIRIVIDGKLYKAHRLAWLYTYGYLPEYGIDHKDRIKHHNWIENLREASQQCNVRNTGNFKNNTSGVKGICWDKSNRKWLARIAINRVSKYLGYYKSFDNAACARLAGEQCVDWSGCDSSSPAFQYVQNNIQNKGK